MLVCLLILTITFFVLTLYDIIQANRVLFHIGASPFWSLKIIDTSTSATLFVTVVGALLVRRQFASSVLPRIDYKSATAARQNSKNSSEFFETWQVEIVNTGDGSAVINNVEYFLEFKDLKSDVHSHVLVGLIKELAIVGLIRDRDYWIENITNGFSLSPKDNCPVFEIKTEHIKTFKRLTMVLYFQGKLGDKYRSEISLIPRL